MSDFATDRVLVTGASGFIGARALPALRARGLTPVAVGRTQPADPQTPWIAADLADAEATRDAVRRAGAGRLLHLAWTVAPGRFWRDPDNLQWVARSLLLLRTFAEAGGVRAVLAGTCAEYAWDGEGRLSETATPLRPATLYGAAKDATRRVAEAYAADVGLSLAWGRIFFLFGPGEKRGRLVSDAAAALAAGQTFDATEGSQLRDFVHVDDVAGAFAAITAGDVRGAVNIGRGQAVPVRAVLEALERAADRTGLIRYGARAAPAGDPPCIEADATRLWREVGYTPHIGLDAGAAAVMANLRAR